MPADKCRQNSLEICKKIINLKLDENLDNILLYSAIRNEVDTTEYFKYLVQRGKKIYYPKVEGDNMSFYRVKSQDELSTGAFNIAEPDATQRYSAADGRALMIVPGLAFSDSGYRIGYGKGFYDRYLSQEEMRQMVTAVGICYDFQLVEGISFEDAYDVSLDGVVTDKREVFDYD